MSDRRSLLPGALLLAAFVPALLGCSADPRGGAAGPAPGGLVVAQEARAARVGAAVLREGGNAVDAAVATAFALAVTHPTAGNLGGGGFLVWRSADGAADAYDFRETAPAAAAPTMWLDADGRYDEDRHHEGWLAIGVPGSVAGLHLAWQQHGRLPWARLVAPAVALADSGFVVTAPLAASLAAKWPRLVPHPTTVAQFGKDGAPLVEGDTLRQPDLARTLRRIAAQGPDGFYGGETADLIADAMQAHGGLVTRADLAGYRAVRREPIRAAYRGCTVIGMPPPSSGGVVLGEMLAVLEGYDLAASGPGTARTVHLMAETMRRAYADRARFLGDPEANPGLPIARLLGRAHADSLRTGIDSLHATPSDPARFPWPDESDETTHLSVVDADGNAVALTTTLEYGYGSGIVVPGGGFLLNNEMGDFNAAPGLTDTTGLIGTDANLAGPGRRMLSSMAPTIVEEDGRLRMVAGAMGGRTIITTVLQLVVDIVDFGLTAQQAVDAPRIHHQWLPDRILVEPGALAPEAQAALEARGHRVEETTNRYSAEIIVVAPDGTLQAGVDPRDAGAGAGVP
ncbi:MAG TPA: gamma-glutamyltransferase [Candidatus Krumholzibacteria bacterium]|nr:gamma-glutamyltransferase [Candidatus Krumholzibacteria bacterium]